MSRTKELRARAREAGVRGFSTMTLYQLEEALGIPHMKNHFEIGHLPKGTVLPPQRYGTRSSEIWHALDKLQERFAGRVPTRAEALALAQQKGWKSWTVSNEYYKWRRWKEAA